MILNFEDFINEHQGEPQKQGKNYDPYFDLMDKFDVNTIPLYIRKKCYKSFADIFNARNDDFLCEITIYQLTESIEDKNVSSAKSTIENLIKVYGFDESMFRICSPNNVSFIDVRDVPVYLEAKTFIIVPDLNNNVEIIEKEMNANGYYKIRESIQKDNQSMRWMRLIFDPIKQDSITEQIKSHCSVLYHYSELKNDDNIKKYGILARNEGRVYTYNENRVYLFPEKNIETHKKMMRNIMSNRMKNNPDFDNNLMQYTILVDKLPDDIEFYEDPHGRGCIYTKSNIPVDSIVQSMEIKF